MNSPFYRVAHLLNWSPLRRRAVSECLPRGARGIHRVVSYLRIRFEEISACETTIEMIDDNGNIEIVLVEDNGKILQSFTVKAKTKCLRRLKDIAAYNVAKHISSEYDLDYLDIPTTLKPLVKTFIVTYSGNYIIEHGQYLE